MQRLARFMILRGCALLPGALALLSMPSCAATNASESCPANLTQCGFECVDLATASAHCGACGDACAVGAACEAGACAGDCKAGSLDCGGEGKCVDPMTNPAHCGACGFACPEGASCVDGTCGLVCPAGFTQCNGECVDLQSDVQNCSACDVPCPAATWCVEGECRDCPAGQTRCGARCADLQTDARSCGSCENRCPERFVCVEGQCEDDCAPGQDLCNGVCVNLQTSTENCGACGTACEPGTVCNGGVCQSRCGEDQLFCAGQCVNGQTNPLHCGACFQSCTPGFECADAACQNPCPTGQDPCTSGCVDLRTDPENCGTCDNVCSPGLVCGGGLCGCAGETVCGLCSPQDLGSTVPQTVTGTTVGALDGFRPACSTGGAEVGFGFTAPTNGAYTFNTAGSGYDTLLAVASDTCVSLGCNDDSIGLQSQVVTNLRSGQRVYVVVDGFGGSTGAFTLNIQGGTPCTTTDIGNTVPQAVTGDTTSQPDALTPSCGVAAGRDIKYLFTAPADGTYTIDTFGSAFNTILHVRDASCAGAELACNDDAGGGSQSEVTVTLTAGQQVVIVVDGYGSGGFGAVTLNIR